MLCGAKKNRFCWGGKAEIEDAAGKKRSWLSHHASYQIHNLTKLFTVLTKKLEYDSISNASKEAFRTLTIG